MEKLSLILSVYMAVISSGAIVKYFLGLQKKRFCTIREEVKAHRADMQESARKLHKKSEHGGLDYHKGIPLLTLEGWLKDTPVPLDAIRLEFKNCPEKLPKTPNKTRFNYAQKMEKWDPPYIFDDNLQYRLLQVENDRLVFDETPYSYFYKINYGEYLAYQFAKTKKLPNTAQRIKKPSDYCILAGVNTLTVIQDEENLRIIMHNRSRKVGTAMGVYHVIPAGEFQPANRASTSWKDDFSLEKTIMRETAEELLDKQEPDPKGICPFDYEIGPYSQIQEEKKKGNIQFLYFGFGLDPLTLQGEILTCVIYKRETFDAIFGPEPRNSNPEGQIVNTGGYWGQEFTGKVLDSYLNSHPNGGTLPAAKSLLRLFYDWRQHEGLSHG
ncbi:hypothetical protein FACS1894200_09050 [Spirochaetia bacterium]|nr:hypothetical protein FACS1894200_09050 [Spirochaetia bacterium]